MGRNFIAGDECATTASLSDDRSCARCVPDRARPERSHSRRVASSPGAFVGGFYTGLGTPPRGAGINAYGTVPVADVDAPGPATFFDPRGPGVFVAVRAGRGDRCGEVTEGRAGAGWAANKAMKTCASAPMATTSTTVPMPAVPPRSQPAPSTVRPIALLTTGRERPRAAMPVMSPSRGPAPMEAPVAIPLRATPPNMITMQRAVACGGAGASHMTRSMGSSSTRATTCGCLHASVAVRGHLGPRQCERRAGPARPGARRRGRRKPRQGAVGGDRHAARRAGGALLAMPAPMLALPIRNSPCRRRRAPHRASLRSEDPADSVAAYGREIARRHGSRGSCEQTFTVLGYGHDPQTVTPAPRRCPWRER